MESTGSACSLLLLTMAAVSSGRNATEYFQQARFQHSPSRPEDALVFFTAMAPPLICELEKNADWIGGDRLKADLILIVGAARSYYMCSFEGNATVHSNLELIQKGLPDVFHSIGERKLEYSGRKISCTTNSQLPDEYYQLTIQRPNEDRPEKCRDDQLDEKVYVRFPGYPTIICKRYFNEHGFYRFKLPDIVGDWLECAFQVYTDLHTSDENAEKLLYHSLLSRLPSTFEGESLSRVVCSRYASAVGTTNFQLRLPGDTIYYCRFSNF